MHALAALMPYYNALRVSMPRPVRLHQRRHCYL
jgi:hypothetical protein